MSLDPNYIIAPSLNQYFVSKDTGLPMASGTVHFYSDVNRSIPKPVYKLSGSPPSYTYTDIGAVCTISGVGTFDDGSGNDIIPYYYPYDADGEVELYFVQVFDVDSVLQYTREAWPNFFNSSSSDQGIDITNYIPNGQFWAHNNIPPNVITGTPAGQVPAGTSNLQIAPGGWIFQRPGGSTAIDNISFQRNASYVSDPSSSPRYSLLFSCNSPNPSDMYKLVGVQFQDVNKFASDTQSYTFTFSGITSLSVDVPVTINVIKNYGTGGSSQTNTTVASFTITSSETIFSTPIIFGNNNGQNIGPNDDDYVLVVISFPTGIGFTVILDDFSLLIGDIDVMQFPIQTTRDFLVRSVSVSTPDPNGYTLGLPVIQTKDGLSYDFGQVGMITAGVASVTPFGYLPCDGSMYRTAGYSLDGIPYARLQKVLTTLNFVPLIKYTMPIFGTGDNYVTASHIDTGLMVLANNTPSIEAPIVDGVVPTGFTFTQVSPGFASSSSLGLQCFPYGSATAFWALNILNGNATTTNYTGACPQISSNTSPDTSIGEIVGTAVSQQMFSFSVSTVPAASTYIQLASLPSTIKAWFTLDGVGTLPAGAGIPVRIDMLSAMGPNDSTYVIANALSGNAVWTILVLAATSITPNSYFTFISKGQQYYVWYSLNGAGTDPMVPGAIGIPVNYLITDGAGNVQLRTMSAINSVYFKVPNLAGMVVKGWDPNALVDQNIALRYSANNTRYDPTQFGVSHYIGSAQKDVLLGHTHSPLRLGGPSANSDAVVLSGQTGAPPPFFIPTNTADEYIQDTGTGQNDVKNIYFNYFIRY